MISELYPQEKSSVLLNNDILVVRTQGVAFLGSGMTEDDAKTLAINDAKRTALEQAGTYLEANITVLNYKLVKDEIITFTGSLLKIEILKEGRVIINNMFALKVEIKATIDTKLLTQRIAEVRKDYELERQLEIQRGRIEQLEAKIFELQSSGSTNTKQEVEQIVNALTASEWFEKGYEAYENEKYKMAAEYYTKAVDLDSQFASAYNNRGIAYYKLGRYEESIRDYNKAIAIDSQLVIAYNNRGKVYDTFLGKYEESIRDYNKAIAIDPRYAMVYFNRGVVFDKMGQYKKAIDDYTIFLEMHGNKNATADIVKKRIRVLGYAPKD